MEIMYNKSGKFNNKTAVALGNFDGMHAGHMKLIKKIKELDKLKSCVWTFSEHSLNILKNKFYVNCITSRDEKIEILERENIDYLVFQDFNLVRNLSADEFLEEIIINYLNAKVVVCGYNFKFGKFGSGNAEYLKEYLSKRNIEVKIIEPVVCEDKIISSSLVRELIANGDMIKARKFLTRPFSINFKVVYGKQIGRKIGIPTINQIFPEGHIIPKIGIYVCACEVDGVIYKAVTNIGIRPTVNDNNFNNNLSNIINAETHLINFDGDLYDKNIKVEFFLKIRDEIKFANLEDLREQIKRDIEFAREYVI